jgi:transcriptional regulator GlxA family with amidase domain
MARRQEKFIELTVVQVGFLLFDDVEEMDFAGPLEVFGVASSLMGKILIVTVSKEGRLVQCRHGLKVQPDCSFSECPPLDLLIVPGGRGAREHAMLDHDTLSFVRAKASGGHIASVCTGALVVAEAGLLEGKEATTHHEYLEALERYPNVKVVRGVRYVREHSVSSSAGITAGIDLALAIVREKFGDTIHDEVVTEMEYGPAERLKAESG